MHVPYSSGCSPQQTAARPWAVHMCFLHTQLINARGTNGVAILLLGHAVFESCVAQEVASCQCKNSCMEWRIPAHHSRQTGSLSDFASHVPTILRDSCIHLSIARVSQAPTKHTTRAMSTALIPSCLLSPDTSTHLHLRCCSAQN